MSGTDFGVVNNFIIVKNTWSLSMSEIAEAI